MSLNNPTITYTPRPAPEAEVGTLAAVYKFILFDCQASKGVPNDLTNNPTPKTVKNGPRIKEQENI